MNDRLLAIKLGTLAVLFSVLTACTVAEAQVEVGEAKASAPIAAPGSILACDSMLHARVTYGVRDLALDGRGNLWVAGDGGVNLHSGLLCCSTP